eukprot:CAMPEP_0182599190 /NCGR_PEP_ID=MMETSP1324-20130603/89820_1 /TAXON_ID=236786 /ORGANISM="Florenciella sp., Strain RCC1587" /LENGTH=386 /DNA_ID=CAMNT_0024817073 /DNA_START=33 /DNA_END=1189 /DNA_ORIENTATION=-
MSDATSHIETVLHHVENRLAWPTDETELKVGTQRVTVYEATGSCGRLCSDGKVVKVHAEVENAALREYDIEYTSYSHSISRHSHGRTTKKVTARRYQLDARGYYSYESDRNASTDRTKLNRWKKLATTGGAVLCRVAVTAGEATDTVDVRLSLDIDTALGLESLSEGTSTVLWDLLRNSKDPAVMQRVQNPTPRACQLGFRRSATEIWGEFEATRLQYETRFNRGDLSIDMLMKFMVTDVPKRAGCGTLRERIEQFYADRKIEAPAEAELQGLIETHAGKESTLMAKLAKDHEDTPLVMDALKVDGMAVTLHPYQREAVEWMVARETACCRGANEHMWTSLAFENADDGEVFFNPLRKKFTMTVPPPATRGGFLCEMMGLGKTIET